MLHLQTLILPAVALAIALSGSAWAQRAPGEDPLQINGKVTHLALPLGTSPKSGSLDGNTEMPAWLSAKVARFEAKAFSAGADDGNLFTDNDINTTTTTQGVRRTCRQDVGSNTTATGIGRAPTAGGTRTNANQQIVVLRGDVVNICR